LHRPRNVTDVARATDLRCRVLGMVEARADGRDIPLPRRLRALLAVLLLHANQPVTASYLIDQVWGSERLANSRRTLHVSVSRLRRAFGPDGDLIQTTSDGYRIELTEDQLDLTAFRDLVTQAGAADDLELRADLLDQALALWSSEPLSDLPLEARVREHASVLLDERLRAIENLCGARLDLGQHQDLLPQLTALTAEYPLRERLWEQLMTALCRSDRPADALATYADLSRHARKAGTTPSEAVRRLHRQILASDPPHDEPATPQSLPPDIAELVGLRDAVADAVALVGRPPGPTVTVFTGSAGTGKTALAVHVAHRMQTRFPDGQWFFELRGAGPVPRPPDEVLDQMLRLCGAMHADLSGDLDAKAAELRTRLAGQRVLIVLDDVSDTRQVIPLLPGTAGSAVIVTSRRPLPGLVVRFGASSRPLQGPATTR
jgi:DNA-binding SARP family transcriptional activator